MDPTIDRFDEEGTERTITSVRTRRECEECGEPAHYKLTFLLEGARRNPASSAYGRDDCSYCEDESRFLCTLHEKSGMCRRMDGYEWCSTFSASERFKHLFLYWKERE